MEFRPLARLCLDQRTPLVAEGRSLVNFVPKIPSRPSFDLSSARSCAADFATDSIDLILFVVPPIVDDLGDATDVDMVGRFVQQIENPAE